LFSVFENKNKYCKVGLNYTNKGKYNKPKCKPVNIGFTIDWMPLGELIEEPRQGKPDLTNDRCQPQAIGIRHRMSDTILEEEAQDNETKNNNNSVEIELVGGEWDNAAQW
jgi:hypothetical protein